MGRYLDIVNRTLDRLEAVRPPASHSPSRQANERNEIYEAENGLDAAGALLDALLDDGAAFEVVRHANQDELLWFGPATTVTPEVLAKIHQHKARIVGLLQSGQYPCSRRTWGEPSAQNWEEHPGYPGNVSG